MDLSNPPSLVKEQQHQFELQSTGADVALRKRDKTTDSLSKLVLRLASGHLRVVKQLWTFLESGAQRPFASGATQRLRTEYDRLEAQVWGNSLGANIARRCARLNR